MKMMNRLLFSVLLSLIILLFAHSKSLKTDIHPNVGEITNEYHKMVKPFYQKNFFPTEVKSIREPVVKPAYDFQNAEIVGPVSPRGQEEKPTMYSTVITKHATSVLHPVPKMGNTANQAAGALFSSDPKKEYPVKQIQPGTYAIPVKLETSSKISNDPTLAGYETPQIKGKSEVNRLAESKLGENHIMMAQVKEDVNNITSKIRNIKSNKEKIKILTQGRAALEKEAKTLSSLVQSDVAEMVNAKQLALGFNNALAKYEIKLKKSQMSRLKLSDVITMKKQLIDKLSKEIQGFRTASANYKELAHVDPKDIKRILRQIKKKLNY